MVIYIANRSMTIIDCFTSELRNPIRVISDSDDEKVESGNIIFNFSMSFSEDQKERVRSEIQAGNFVLRKRKHGSLYECFTIVNREYDSEDNTISAYCEDEGMDLLNETLTAVNQDENKKKEYTLEEYMSTAVYDSGFSVDYDGSSNVQEMKAEKKALSFSQETALKRVQNLADAYGFEFYVFYDIFQMKIIKKYIKVIEKRGNDNGIQLRVGKEIKNIRETTSIENVATAIIAIGNTPYSYHKYADDVNGANMSDDSTHSVTNPKTGKASNKKRSYYGYTVTSTSPTAPTDPKAYTWITMDEYEKLRDADDSRLKAQTVTLSGYKYDDNDIYVDGTMLKSRSGLAKWSRYLAERENIGGSDVGHIVTIKTYNEARDQATLCSLAVADLQKMIKEQVNYEVELAYPIENLNVGDYAYLIDDHAGLYLKARLLELKISELNGTFDATFGDYTAQSSGINSTIQNLANEFKTLSNSTRTYYTWVVYADDSAGTNITTDSNGKEYIGVATNRINKTPDLSDPLIYKWTKIKGDKGDTGSDGVAGKDGKGISSTAITYGISDSENTKPTSWNTQVPTLTKGKYLWTRTIWTYTDNTTETGYQKTYIAKDGNTGSDGLPGKDGTGISSTAITYCGSTSGTSHPTSGWQDTVPIVAAGSYLWTRMVWSYTDGTSETGYAVAKMGNTGAKGDTGDTGVSVVNTTIEYCLSKSNTSLSDPTSWASTKPEYVDGKYYWFRIKTDYSDGTTKYSDPSYDAAATVDAINAKEAKDTADEAKEVSEKAKADAANALTSANGKGRNYYQTTAPESGTENDTWYQLDSKGKVSKIYRWDSANSTWAEAAYDASVLKVENLAALSADLGNVTGGNILGGTIRSHWSVIGSGHDASHFGRWRLNGNGLFYDVAVGIDDVVNGEEVIYPPKDDTTSYDSHKVTGYSSDPQYTEVDIAMDGNPYARGNNFLRRTYPVGAVYIAVNEKSPANLFGGTWERIKDRFLLAAGDTYSLGNTGGEISHQLTTDEMPSHRHQAHFNQVVDESGGGNYGLNVGGDGAKGRVIVYNNYNYNSGEYIGYEGGNAAHNNMPPYLTVYVWKRIS